MPKIPKTRPKGATPSCSGNSSSTPGVLEELPLQLGVAPFGLVFGILGIESGLSPIQTISLSLILFGGASQIVFAQLVAAATPFGIILSSVTMINLRHVLYGLSMASYLRKLPIYWRVLLAYLLTDEAYAVSIRRFSQQPPSRYMHFHLLGTLCPVSENAYSVRVVVVKTCLLYTSPSPRDQRGARMPSSA